MGVGERKKVGLRWVHVRLAFGHRHMRRGCRAQTQTRSDSLSTVKVKVFITSELPSICGRYLFATLHLQLPHPSPPSPFELLPHLPLSGTAVGTSWHFAGDETLHEIQSPRRIIIWRSNIVEPLRKM